MTAIDKWIRFFKRVLRFPVRLVKNTGLLFYFLIVICFVGALGALIPIGQMLNGNTNLTWLSVHHNLATYVIAISVTAFADCLVRRQQEDDPIFMLFLLGLMLLTVTGAICILVIQRVDVVSRLSHWTAAFAAVVWLMVHDADPALTGDEVDSPLGGKVKI